LALDLNEESTNQKKKKDLKKLKKLDASKAWKEIRPGLIHSCLERKVKAERTNLTYLLACSPIYLIPLL